MLSDALRVVSEIASALDEVEAPYAIVGSVASSFYGFPRSTQDIDVLAKIDPKNVTRLIQSLEAHFIVDPAALRDAVRLGEAFNIFHRDTMYKVDLFPAKANAWQSLEIARAQERGIDPRGQARKVRFASPEDVILAKLDWYRQGEGASDRQWKDVVEIIRVQRPRLEFDYLRDWALRLNVADLLDQAIDEVGAADVDRENSD
jgi:hypothetical protein